MQLIKGISLAAIAGFTGLARAGGIISDQTFKPLIVYAVVGVIYSPSAGPCRSTARSWSAGSP